MKLLSIPEARVIAIQLTIPLTLAVSGAAHADIQNHQINQFNPSLRTISVQELKQKLEEYETNDRTTGLPGLPAGGNNPADALGKSMQAAASPDAWKAALRGRISSLLGATADAAQQGAVPSQGGTAVPAGAANPLPSSTNAAATSSSSGTSTSFPVNYNDARDAVRLFANKNVDAVLINSLKRGSFNVVAPTGRYASLITPFDEAMRATAPPETANTTPTPNLERRMTNAPRNVQTYGSGQAPNQNPNGIYGQGDK